MPAMLTTKVDFVEELMYRCWARRNYVPMELRERDWHPIILEEMAHRDGELAEAEARELVYEIPQSSFVPLLPTVTHFVHPAEYEIREPHFLTERSIAGGVFTDSIYAGGIYSFKM